MNKYKISSLGGSSDKYGKCEVCGKHVSDVFIQQPYEQFTGPDGEVCWETKESIFGHKECLLSMRTDETKEPLEENTYGND